MRRLGRSSKPHGSPWITSVSTLNERLSCGNCASPADGSWRQPIGNGGALNVTCTTVLKQKS